MGGESQSSPKPGNGKREREREEKDQLDERPMEAAIGKFEAHVFPISGCGFYVNLFVASSSSAIVKSRV
jgi:hypothetical protein